MGSDKGQMESGRKTTRDAMRKGRRIMEAERGTD